MTDDKPEALTDAASASVPVLLDARLTPHRSLSRRGFTALMLAFGGISFAAGSVFVAMGAWPVMGFFGLDVLLLWYALKTNFGAAKISEQVTVSAHCLTLRRFARDREVMAMRFNPDWVSIQSRSDDEDGMLYLGLRCHGKTHTLGAFLDPASRESFHRALQSALFAAKKRVYQPSSHDFTASLS